MPSKAPRFGATAQSLRLLLLATWFNASCSAIHAGQLLLSPLRIVSKPLFYRYIMLSKEQFGILIITITQWFMPTVIRVSGDPSMRGLLTKTRDGCLVSHMPERLVLIANHQIYTEWLYLWWIAYTSNMHGAIYIMLKDSLRKIPIFGPAMMYYGFVFMSRRWSTDQARLNHRLKNLREYRPSELWPSRSQEIKQDPMWFIIFPEGTNLSANTQRRSIEYANKTFHPQSAIVKRPFRHTVIPRTTGLRYTLQELGTSVKWVYDITIGYEGVPRGQYAQDIFTLRSTFLGGRPPKSVNLYFRRIHIDLIPLQEAERFEEWLLGFWQDKDDLLEYYLEHGSFPADEDPSSPPGGPAGVSHIETEVRLSSPLEIAKIFLPLLGLAVAAYVFAIIYNVIRYGRFGGKG